MSNSIDYGYDCDEIMEFCKNDCNTTLEEFSTNLNSLADEMPLCEECFHSTKKGDALHEIYDGFSDCIGSTKANSGLAGLLSECAKIVNTVYSEAYTNKKITEDGDFTDYDESDTQSSSTKSSTSSTATASDFNYKYEESNEIAAVAKNMGFTDEQIAIAVGISRLETGNYTSSAFLNKNNYGGLTNKDGRMSFDSQESGIEAYLNNLKKNYFDQGLNTPEEMQSKYCPDGSQWAQNVRGCMS